MESTRLLCKQGVTGSIPVTSTNFQAKLGAMLKASLGFMFSHGFRARS